jgi:hypothetical protein
MLEDLKKNYFSAKESVVKIPCYIANEKERDILKTINLYEFLST